MSINATITFGIDEDFSETDLKCMLSYKHMWCALDNIRDELRLYYREKKEISEAMTVRDFAEMMYEFVLEEMDGIPSLE